MHEASLMTGLMRQIDAIVRKEGASKVTQVKVWCGALSHMTEAHFAEHFEQASKGTLAEDAALDVTISDDPADDRAQDVILESLDIAD